MDHGNAKPVCTGPSHHPADGLCRRHSQLTTCLMRVLSVGKLRLVDESVKGLVPDGAGFFAWSQQSPRCRSVNRCCPSAWLWNKDLL